MTFPNVRQVSHSLVSRYQQNRPNVFCSCSLRNRRYFIFYFILIFLFFVCACFSGEQRQVRSELGAPDTRDEERRPCSQPAISRRISGRRFSPPKATTGNTFAVCRLHLPSLAWKTQKNNACCAGYHSWAEVKVGVYEKKMPKGNKRTPCLLKTEWRDCELIVVSVESMRSLLRLLILIIQI